MDKNIDKFIQLLEKKYGEFDRKKALFGTTTYGKIAKDLSISGSQFTKLLYGSATLGMYERMFNNINRLIERQSIEKAYEQTLTILQKSKKTNRKKNIFFLILFLGVGITTIFLLKYNNFVGNESDYEKHPLEYYFYPEPSTLFVSPFISDSAISENCPCTGFEGKWVLSKSFKLPLPGTKKPGLYYQAKSAVMMLRCSNLFGSYIEKGHAMMGYEHLKSEIWIDTKQEPLVPQYFNPSNKEFTESFKNLAFESNPRFKKIADLDAFNVNMFEIHGDSIVRKAELTGRLTINVDESLVKEYMIDIKYITTNVLGELNITNCKTAVNPFCDPNDLSVGSVISFDCLYTISKENLGLDGAYPYTKSFKFENQVFSDYLPCGCDDK